MSHTTVPPATTTSRGTLPAPELVEQSADSLPPKGKGKGKSRSKTKPVRLFDRSPEPGRSAAARYNTGTCIFTGDTIVTDIYTGEVVRRSAAGSPPSSSGPTFVPTQQAPEPPWQPSLRMSDQQQSERGDRSRSRRGGADATWSMTAAGAFFASQPPGADAASTTEVVYELTPGNWVFGICISLLFIMLVPCILRELSLCLPTVNPF